MLLALTRPSRSADLSQLSLSGKHFKPDGVSFIPSSLVKQSQQGKRPSFPHEPGLYPVVTLKDYEERTTHVRRAELKPLLALIKWFEAVTSSTIARWLKSLLELAGVDTSIFNAHSVHGASSTTAANLGITTNDIPKAADWNLSQSFKNFIKTIPHSVKRCSRQPNLHTDTGTTVSRSLLCIIILLLCRAMTVKYIYRHELLLGYS